MVLKESTVFWETEYEIIVLGGGVAGVAAAVAAGREGKKVLLIEKALQLGGLATYGLINLFEPLCNGRGIQVITGMAEEFLKLSIKDGYHTLDPEWHGKKPEGYTEKRYTTRYSAPIFSMVLTELLSREGVDLLLDCLATHPIMEGKLCTGVETHSKSGKINFKGKIIIDTTGDGDLLYAAGVPMQEQGNFFTYVSQLINLDSVKKAYESGDIGKAIRPFYGGHATLYGANQPEEEPLYKGTDVKQISDYVIKNHKILLDKLRKTPPESRDVVTLPGMPQFRTTRCMIGNHVFLEEDQYTHFHDSIGAICDFSRRDYLFEVPYGTLIHKDYPNLITAGRSASAKGFGWDILRVIPPAILTGQGAGIAAAMAVTDKGSLSDVSIPRLQEKLKDAGVTIHFEEDWIPENKEKSGEYADTKGHV